MKCPHCNGNEVRLLVALNPGVILKCSKCGEVWREGEDLGLAKFRVLYEPRLKKREVWGE